MAYDTLQPMLERIKMVTGFLADPHRKVDTVGAIEESYLDSPQMQACVERMKADPDMGALIAKGYATPDYDLEELIKYPPGSLAHTYAKLLQLSGYASHFYGDREIKTDADYCIMRIRKTHDLHHTVTGFAMREGGEPGVIGVPAYQFGYPAFVLIDLAVMALSFRRGEGFDRNFADVGRGMRIGQECKPLAGIKWEEGWEKPLSVWREELRITPVTTGPASWYGLPGVWS